MKKRVLSLFLCFVLCLSLCPTAAFADGEEGHTHEPQEEAPLVVSATMAPEPTEVPAEPTAEPAPEPAAEPEPTAEATPEPTVEPTAAPETETTPEPTAEPAPEPVAAMLGDAAFDGEGDGGEPATSTYEASVTGVDGTTTTNYATLQEAINAAIEAAPTTESATRPVVTLLKDITTTQTITFGDNNYSNSGRYIELAFNSYSIGWAEGAGKTQATDTLLKIHRYVKATGTGTVNGVVFGCYGGWEMPADTNVTVDTINAGPYYVYICGGTVKTLDVTYSNINICGGTFGKITTVNVQEDGESYYLPCVRLLLSYSGQQYAFMKDGTVVNANIQTLENVTVAAHTHSYDKNNPTGYCSCGYECDHRNRVYDEEHDYWAPVSTVTTTAGVTSCALCGVQFEARVMVGESGSSYTMDEYCLTLADAFALVEKISGYGSYTITLLKNATLASDITLSKPSYQQYIVLDLNGHSIAGPGGINVTAVTPAYSDYWIGLRVINGATQAASLSKLTISGALGKVWVASGTVDALTVTAGTANVVGGTVNTLNADGGTVNVFSGTVNALNVGTGAGTVFIENGAVNAITGPESKTLGELLPNGKLFKNGSTVIPNTTKLNAVPSLRGYTLADCDHACGMSDSGYCTNCGADCRVVTVTVGETTTSYASVEAAFAAAKTAASGTETVTVTLLKNAAVTNAISLTSGKYTLVLASYMLSNGDRIFDLSGTAELKVATGDSGSIKSTDKDAAPISVSGSAKLTLEAATIADASGNDLRLYGGTTTVTGTANVQTNVSIENGELCISGGTVKTLYANSDSTVTVSGGTVSSLYARSGSTVTVSGGTVGTLNAGMGGTVKLSGGSFGSIVLPSGKTYLDLLENGRAFQRGGSDVDASGTSLPGEGGITVAEHTCSYDAETGKCACGRVRAAQIGEGDAAVIYSSLEAALEAAQNGDTITLLADVTAPRIGTGNNNQLDWSGKTGKITIDLNGKTLSSGGSLYIYGDVTIKDDSTAKSGSVVVGTDPALSSTQYVRVGESTKTGYLTIAGGNFSDVTLKKGTLNVSGGTISALSFSSGTNSNDKLTISGGTITTAYFTESSEKTVSGGNIGTLWLGVKCTAENTKLSGGTVTTELKFMGGKAAFSEAFRFKKIIADSGKLVDRLPAGKAFSIGETVSSADTDTIEATGENEYITLKDHDCDQIEDGTCACGRVYEASIDDTLYATFEAALAAVEENDTITLVANASVPTVTTVEGESAVTNSQIAPSVPVIIDLNGKTLSGAGNLTLSGTVTITDGAERGKLRAGDGKSVISTDTLTITDGDVSPLTVTGGNVKIRENGLIGTLYIHGGEVTVTGGTINQIDYPAKVDGSDNQGTLKMSGGQFQTITKQADMPAGGYLALLEPGYAFYLNNTLNGTLQNAKTAEWFTSGTEDLYSVVSHTCAPQGITNGMCGCGREYAAYTDTDTGITLHKTLTEAVTAAGEDGTVHLLADLMAAKVQGTTGDGEGAAAEGPAAEEPAEAPVGSWDTYSTFKPDSNVTIDLNGYNITGTGDLYLIGPMTITNTKNTGAVSTTTEKSVIIGGEVTLAGGASITNAVAVAGADDYPSSPAVAEHTDYAAGELLMTGGSATTVNLKNGGTVRVNGGSVTTLDVADGTLTVSNATDGTVGTVGTLNVTNAAATVVLSGGKFGGINSTELYLQKLLAPNHAFSTSTSTANITNAAWDKNSWTATTETPYLYVVPHASHTPDSSGVTNTGTHCACGQSLTLAITNGDSTTYFTDFDANALNNLRNGGTAKLISNTKLTTNVTMPETSFTLDLNGFNISNQGNSGSITVPTGSTMTLTTAIEPRGTNCSVIPPITVDGTLTVRGEVAVESIYCDSTDAEVTIGNDGDTVQPSVKTLTVHGDPAGRVALKNGVELMNIGFGTGEPYTLLDLLGNGQAFKEHWKDGDTEQSALYNANVSVYSTENRWLTVVAHENCTYDKTAATGHCACGRACPHSAGFDDETGACGTCGAQMAARIGDKYYASFADAVQAAQTGDTITLLADVTGTGAVTFPAGSYTIDLNGKALGEESNTYNITLLPDADVTIKDSTEDSSKSGRKVRIALPMVAAPITVQGKTESGSTTVGKLTLNGVDAADVTLLNQEGGALNAEEMLTLQGGASVTTLRVHGGGVALGGALKTALAETDIVLGDGTTGGYLDIASGVTVKNVTVNSASTLDITGGTAAAVDVKSGGIIKMTGGNVTTMTIAPIPGDGTAKLANFTISGGEIETLALGDTGVATYASIHKGLTGGSYGKIEIKGGASPAVRELLAPGYAFKKDGAFVLLGDAQGVSIENVNVAKCVHQNNTLGAECLYCVQPLVAQLDADGKVSFYTSFADALAAAPTTGESVITLLKDCGDGSATHQVNKTLRLILGGHKLKDTLEITAGGCLTVANSSGSTLAAIEQTGGTLKVESDAQATITTLTVSGGETKLSGGTYNSITTSNGITAGSLLAANSAYYQTAEGGGKTWLTVANETALQNVSVGLIPLHGMELSASPENPTYGTELTLTASHVYGAAYQWYEVVNGTENTITTPETDPYKLELRPNAGSHTYRCKVTKDGYTVTLDKTVTVAKADIGNDFLTPKANTGLIYNGGEQALIQAGSFNPGVTGCSIQYKLGADGTYGADADALTGTDAKTYTVYYYVDGGTNYNSIGSADSPREIKVTIAPLDIGGNSARLYYVTPNYTIPYYNGQPQAPAITLTLVHRNNTSPTETTIIEIADLVKDVDYTQSVTQHTNAGFYPASFTGMGNYTGTKTVDWNIERLNASDASGSLTVYNQVAHTYTVDLASLLPELPSGYEYGKLAYALNAVGDGDDDSKITVEGYLGEYSLTNGTLTLPVNAVDSTDTGAIAALRVTVTPENYFPFTLTLNISRANRVSPIDVGAPLDGLTKENVTSDDREDIEDLLDDLEGYLAQNPGEGETKELEDLKKEAEELIERLDDAKAAMEDDAIGAADDIDASNAKPGHKGKLRSAKKAIQDALDTYGPNYTAAEKAALNEKLTRINAALEAIEKLEQAEENARNDRTDKPVKTGDEATPILWIVLIVAAAGCVVVLLAARKKKK